jgi:hypothetical protein
VLKAVPEVELGSAFAAIEKPKSCHVVRVGLRPIAVTKSGCLLSDPVASLRPIKAALLLISKEEIVPLSRVTFPMPRPGTPPIILIKLLAGSVLKESSALLPLLASFRLVTLPVVSKAPLFVGAPDIPNASTGIPEPEILPPLTVIVPALIAFPVPKSMIGAAIAGTDINVTLSKSARGTSFVEEDIFIISP